MTIALRAFGALGAMGLLTAAALTLPSCQRQQAGAPVVRQASLGSSPDIAAAPASELEHAEAATEAVRLTAREPWQYADAEGELIITPNYRLYTTIESERVLASLPELYEQALDHYTSALANLPKPSEPLETFLFQSRSQWEAKTHEMLPEQAEMFSNLGRGGFTTRGTSVLYYIDRRDSTRDTFAIAAHEGWHQYTQRTFKHQLPIWLEEGVATYMEGYTTETGVLEFKPSANRERQSTLSRAVRDNRLIELNDLLTRSPQSFLSESKTTLLVYYAQSWGLIRFLAEGEEGRYRPALAQVLIDAAHGKLAGRMLNSPTTANIPRRSASAAARMGPAVVQEYFNANLEEFEAQYRAFVVELATQDWNSRNWGDRR